MSSLEKSIRETLLTDAAIVGMVGDRVSPLSAHQDDQRPYLTFSVERERGFHTLADGPAEYVRATVELGIYADDVIDVAELSENCRALLDGYGGTVAGVEWDAELDEENEIEEGYIPGTDQLAFGRIQRYSVLYRLIS